MPQVEYKLGSNFEPLRLLEKPPQIAPVAGSWGDLFNAAKEMDNPVYNAYELLTRDRFKWQEDYDLVSAAKKRGVDPTLFTETFSEAELDFEIAKRAREQKNREILDANGWLGYAASIASGTLSPTTALPFLQGFTGLRSIALGGASVMAGAAIDESVLYTNQSTRTKEEVGFSLGASLILGGIFGGVGHTIAKKNFAKMAHNMVNPPKEPAISSPMPFGPMSVGAAEAETLADAGALKKGLGADKLAFLSGITRNFEQWNAPAFMKEMGGSTQLRKMTGGFSQATLVLEKNKDWIAASAGGNVEELKKVYSAVSFAGRKTIDDQYVKYILGEKVEGPFKNTRAKFAGSRADGKLDYDEFKKQITLDILSNFKREGVPKELRAAAQKIDQEVFKKLYDEGVEVGIFTGKEKIVGDENYVNRVYRHEVISRRYEEFVQILANNYAKKLQLTFKEGYEKLQEAMQKDKTLLEDVKRPLDEVLALQESIKQQAQMLQTQTSLDVIEGIDSLRGIRKELKAIKDQLDAVKVKPINGGDFEGFRQRKDKMDELEAAIKAKALQAENVRKALGDDFDKYEKAVAETRRRLSNLRQAVSLSDQRLQKKLQKIEANEDAQIGTIIRASKKLEKFSKLLTTTTDDKLDDLISDLKGTFADLEKKFNKIEEQRTKIIEEGYDGVKIPQRKTAEEKDFENLFGQTADGTAPEMLLADKAEVLAAKMDNFAARIENLSTFDREGWRKGIDEMMRELAETQANINAKRVLRNERLWRQVENLSPEAQAKKIAAFELKAKERPLKFLARWKPQTQEGDDLLRGQANFADVADTMARQVVDKIQGTNRRLAYSDIIQAERGPELARVLDISSAEIADFLETDIEHLISVYTRTVGSDIAVARVFGTADAAGAFLKLNDERQQMKKQIANLKDKKGNPLDKEQQEQLSKEVDDFYDEGRKNLLVLLERAKGIRGIGSDPNAWSVRAARVALDLNYLRLMGGVVVNSVADPARNIMKYGLTRTFRDGFFPMLTAFKEIRMSQREAQLAGTANDVILHTRANAMMDIFDDAYRGTIAEKGIHYLSTRMGAIALFDQWTSAMKQFTAGIVNAKLLDSIALVMGDGKGSAREIKKAQEFLAKNNINEEIAQVIWGQVTNGQGGGKVNGVWLPNTESWNISNPAVARARRAYRAALVGEVDATIITPGFERPNWMDWNIPARLVGQFKAFGFSSTQRTLMAGLQQHDAAFVNGVMISLALGAVSYYLWAVAAGGDAKKRMVNALNDLDGEGWKVFADEAIERSGVTGVFSEVGKFAHRIPVLRDYASFSGSDSTRRAGGDLSELTLGPTFDLMEKAYGVMVGLDDPTAQTLHMARQLLPFQNVFYFRRLLDQIEQSADLPKNRRQ
jgi:hypothetical protein